MVLFVVILIASSFNNSAVDGSKSTMPVIEEEQDGPCVDDSRKPTCYDGFNIDYSKNFINGARYGQIDIGRNPLDYRGALEYCSSKAKDRNAIGFFYQMH